MNYDYPKFYDDSADYPQFPELTAEKQKKRTLLKRAAESEKRYRELSRMKSAGNRTTNDQTANVECVLNGDDLPVEVDIDAEMALSNKPMRCCVMRIACESDGVLVTARVADCKSAKGHLLGRQHRPE
jgi:hypothetical protein